MMIQKLNQLAQKHFLRHHSHISKFQKRVHHYDHFLSSNRELRYIEFLGACFMDNEYTSIFKEFKSEIASFLNVKELNIHLNKISLHQNLTLLVSANVKITFLRDNDDESNSDDDDDDN